MQIPSRNALSILKDNASEKAKSSKKFLLRYAQEGKKSREKEGKRVEG
ncbi:MAG: hypothetical protein WBB01_04335 [Phormidesmis sp.]